MTAARFTRADFAYALPQHLIAQQPTERRTDSRLLVLDGDALVHERFSAIIDRLAPGDLLVVNDTSVIKARLHAIKDSGGQAEILVERIDDDNEREALCQVRVSKPLKPGRALRTTDEDAGELHVVGREGEFYRLRFPCAVLAFLDRFGEVPLPPYIERPSPDVEDESRYQTVYGAIPGAVAAPTAGLHFDDDLLGAIKAKGIDVASVTLHVGAGTFQPVRVDDLANHRMHFERYAIGSGARRLIDACPGRVIAVGTTVVRTLEAAARSGSDSGETDLFITPGFDFHVVDALVTNFHLPESTLLMLVCAFAGYERVMRAYAAAVAEQYRFFSYGDAMFCERA